jgi:hypothetical protein
MECAQSRFASKSLKAESTRLPRNRECAHRTLHWKGQSSRSGRVRANQKESQGKASGQPEVGHSSGRVFEWCGDTLGQQADQRKLQF